MTRSTPLTALAACLVLGGCEALRQPYPDRSMYAVSVDAPDETLPGDGRGVMKVVRIRVVAPFDDRTFFYKVGPEEFKADYYNTFVSPPDRMFTHMLQKYLLGHGGFDTFLPPHSGADSDLRLEGEVRALYADFTTGPTPEAVIEARFFLISVSLADAVVSAEKTYRKSVTAGSARPEAIARAWGEALTLIYAELADDLVEAIEPGTYDRKAAPPVEPPGGDDEAAHDAGPAEPVKAPV